MSLLQAIVAASSSKASTFIPPDPGSNNPPGVFSQSFGTQGTPYNPLTGSSSGPANFSYNLFRRVYKGSWTNTYADQNPSIFDGTPYSSGVDNYIAFGLQTTGETFCMEWKGYWKAPSTGNWNFKVQADDVVMFWIGDAALNPNNSNYQCNNGVNSGLNQNSVSLTQNNWYPIRVRYQEWTGAESLDIFAAPVDSSETLALYNYSWQNLSYDYQTGGY